MYYIQARLSRNPIQDYEIFLNTVPSGGISIDDKRWKEFFLINTILDTFALNIKPQDCGVWLTYLVEITNLGNIRLSFGGREEYEENL